MTKGAWLRMGLVAAPYASQGVSASFIAIVLQDRLVNNGMDAKDVGLILAAGTAPWLLKWLVGPAIDATKRYALWVVAATVAMACSITAMGSETAKWITMVVIAHNIAKIFQDVAADAWSINLLRKEERGIGRAFIQGANTLGKMAGGGGLILLMGLVPGEVPWRAYAIAASVMTVTPTILILVLGKQDQPCNTTEDLGLFKRKSPFQELKSLLKGADKKAFLAAVCLTTVSLSYYLAATVIIPWIQEIGCSRETFGELTIMESIFEFVGVILGGILATLLVKRRKLALVITILSLTAAYVIIGIVFMSLKPGESQEVIYWTVVGPMSLSGLVGGMYIVTLITVLMDATEVISKRGIATIFALLMVGMNLGQMIFIPLGGWLISTEAMVLSIPLIGQLSIQAPAFSTPEVLVLAALSQLATLIPLRWVKLDRK